MGDRRGFVFVMWLLGFLLCLQVFGCLCLIGRLRGSMCCLNLQKCNSRELAYPFWRVLL
jgi:hypothetical protein